jgi:YgiT-type zinc finger domain-containing protein
MSSDRDVPDLAVVREQMHVWRQSHPHATLTEIEQELDHRLDAARAAVLAEVAGTDAAAAGTCPACGERLVRHGMKERTLTTRGDEPLILRRPAARCPRCGSGLFPPG